MVVTYHRLLFEHFCRILATTNNLTRKLQFFRINEEDAQGERGGETGEIIIVGKHPVDALYGETSHRYAMPITDMTFLIGHHFDACLAVCKMHERDGARLMNTGLLLLLFRQTVRDGDMTVSFPVDTLHFATEKRPVRTSVRKLVDGDIIMNHLMQDGIVQQFFRQVDTGIDTEHEVFIAESPEKTLFAAGIGYFAKKSLGMA